MACLGLLIPEQGLPWMAGWAQRERVQPRDIQVIGQELALKWDDDTEQFVSLEVVRRFCPCAGCLGEKDIFGTTYRPPERPYGPGAFELAGLHPVGGYAVQPAWRDGHNTGIYTWEWLRRIAGAQVEGGEACDGRGGCGGGGHDHAHGHGHDHGGHHGGCGGHGCGGH